MRIKPLRLGLGNGSPLPTTQLTDFLLLLSDYASNATPTRNGAYPQFQAYTEFCGLSSYVLCVLWATHVLYVVRGDSHPVYHPSLLLLILCDYRRYVNGFPKVFCWFADILRWFRDCSPCFSGGLSGLFSVIPVTTGIPRPPLPGIAQGLFRSVGGCRMQ